NSRRAADPAVRRHNRPAPHASEIAAQSQMSTSRVGNALGTGCQICTKSPRIQPSTPTPIMVSANTICPTPRIRIGLLSDHGVPSVVARQAADNRLEADALAADRNGWEDRSPHPNRQGAND